MEINKRRYKRIKFNLNPESLFEYEQALSEIVHDPFFSNERALFSFPSKIIMQQEKEHDLTRIRLKNYDEK